MIVYGTKMEKMPKSCWECELEFCTLPQSERRKDILLKKYETKRHENCPLLEDRISMPLSKIFKL